jgi:hypothetical protein
MYERVVARPDILAKRKSIVEHVFGTMKRWMDQGFFLMKGLANVRTEFSLTALALQLTPGAQPRFDRGHDRRASIEAFRRNSRANMLSLIAWNAWCAIPGEHVPSHADRSLLHRPPQRARLQVRQH